MELILNPLLWNFIEERKQRGMNLKFQAALLGFTPNDHSIQNKALKEMQVLMERPRYTEKVAEEGLISKFVISTSADPEEPLVFRKDHPIN